MRRPRLHGGALDVRAVPEPAAARGGGIELLLQRVPEAKAQKNRMHLDLRTPDMEGDVERLLGLGARRITERPIEEEGWRWHVLQDPDGNDLCVLEPPPSADA